MLPTCCMTGDFGAHLQVWRLSDVALLQTIELPVTKAGDGHKQRLYLVSLDRRTAALAIDQRFRDSGATAAGVIFARRRWPHGASGDARPHGSVLPAVVRCGLLGDASRVPTPSDRDRRTSSYRSRLPTARMRRRWRASSLSLTVLPSCRPR